MTPSVPALYTCLLHGIDTLEVSYFLDATGSDLNFETLYLSKVKAAESKRNRWTEITLGTLDFLVMPCTSSEQSGRVRF